jgi:hypothetical protein
MRRAAFFLLIAPALTGCGPAMCNFARATLSVETTALAVTSLVVTTRALGHDTRVTGDEDDEPLPYVPAPPGPPLSPSARDAVAPDEEARFDGLAARAALGRLDLASCRSRGAPHGYGHARVTFAEDGHVARVLIDAPSGLAEDAVACVGARLGEARVAPFAGPAAPVGFQTFVP